MFEKICFLVHENLYNSKIYFTDHLANALRARGIEVKIITIEENHMTDEQIRSLMLFSPSFSCSFNTMLPQKEGKYLWDLLEIPHLSILVDPAIYYLSLTKSAYSILSYVDRKDAEVIGATGFTTSFFFPHAVESALKERPLPKERPYPVTLIGSCYDHESVKRAWEAQYPEKLSHAILEVVERTLSEPNTSFLEAIVAVWNERGLDFKHVDFQSICTYADYYLRGIDRFNLIHAIQDQEIHIFGDVFWIEGKQLKGWREYLKGAKNVVVHEPVPFDQAFDVLAKSRLCLNSTPFFKDGSHERILLSLMAGCSVLTSENRYPREIFGEGSGITYYKHSEMGELNHVVNELLSDEKKRLQRVEKGREIVLQGHTWESRVDLLLEKMQEMVGEVYAKTSNPN